MSDPTTIAALIARVEAGETGRTIDGDIQRFLTPNPTTVFVLTNYVLNCLAFTTSIDSHAALPGRIVVMEMVGKDRWWARTQTEDGTLLVSYAPTECAARLAALLRGLEGAGG